MFVDRFWGSLATHSQEVEAHSACRPKHKEKVVAEIAIKISMATATPFHHIGALPMLQQLFNQGPVKSACAYVSAHGLNAPPERFTDE